MKPREPAPREPLDVIDCIDYGYRTLWQERHYLLRLAAVPVLVKLICFMILLLVGWQTDFVRSALVLLPSYFTEGWMLAHLIRLVFYDQRWPFVPCGNAALDQAVLQERAYGITAGALFYVVIKFLLAGFKAILNSVQTAAVEKLPVQGEAPTGTALVALLLMFLTLWGFRLVFLYIPAAAGMRPDFLIRCPRSLKVSLQLLGVWLVSVVPMILALLMVSSVLVSGHMTAGTAVPMLSSIVLVLFQVFFDTVIAILSTLAAAQGIKKMVESKPRSI